MKITNLLFLIIYISILFVLPCCDDSDSSGDSSITIPSELQGKWHIETYAVATPYPGIYEFHRECNDREICGNLIYNFETLNASLKELAIFCRSGYDYLETVFIVDFKLIELNGKELTFEVVEYNGNVNDVVDTYFRVGSKHTLDYWFGDEYLYLSFDKGTSECYSKM